MSEVNLITVTHSYTHVMGKTACSYPPFLEQHHSMFSSFIDGERNLEECELPVIDARGLWSGDEREKSICRGEMVCAASEWGFFRLLHHAVSRELLQQMREEQMKIFELPFEKKASGSILNGSYRWGAASNNSWKQFSWSEAFHFPLDKISDDNVEEVHLLRKVMKEFAAEMSKLAMTLAGQLAENLGQSDRYFFENCSEGTCFLRLNRYPPCPVSGYGLMPHTDSDFLTLLHQDDVGGLQLRKDNRWVSVKPNPDALIVNIGDLFQAWSNGTYRSVEHRVTANKQKERFSVAYFLCPSFDSVIRSCKEPPVYKQFTFGEFREQTMRDVQKVGHKVGLPFHGFFFEIIVYVR